MTVDSVAVISERTILPKIGRVKSYLQVVERKTRLRLSLTPLIMILQVQQKGESVRWASLRLYCCSSRAMASDLFRNFGKCRLYCQACSLLNAVMAIHTALCSLKPQTNEFHCVLCDRVYYSADSYSNSVL